MARIEPLTPAELESRGVDVSPFLKEFVELPGSVATLGYRPDILGGTLALWDAVMNAGALSAELKYLTGYLASKAAGCLYCSAHTATNAVGNGASSARLDAIWEYESSPLFSDAERAAFRFAQLAGQSPSAVEDEDMARLKLHYETEEIVELLAVVSLYGFFNRWNDSLAIKLEATPRIFAEKHLTTQGWDIGTHG